MQDKFHEHVNKAEFSTNMKHIIEGSTRKLKIRNSHFCTTGRRTLSARIKFEFYVSSNFKHIICEILKIQRSDYSRNTYGIMQFLIL